MRKKIDDRIRELEEMLEALVIAVPKEEAAYHFYLNLANSTKQEGTRRMFIKLADQEIDHKSTLEKFAEDVQRELTELKAEKAKA